MFTHQLLILLFIGYIVYTIDIKKNFFPVPVVLVVIGLAMSYFFIHSWGLTGAAWSVFVTELLSLTIMNYFFKNGVILKIQLSSLNYKTYK